MNDAERILAESMARSLTRGAYRLCSNRRDHRRSLGRERYPDKLDDHFANSDATSDVA